MTNSVRFMLAGLERGVGMSYKRFLFLLTMLAVLTMAVRISVASDTWWHLRAGAWIVEHRAILDTDPFSLTRQGQAWIYPGWLAQLGLYFAYRIAGFVGLNILTAIFVLGAFMFLWDITEVRPFVRSCLILLAATTSAVYWSARPHIFSFFLASVFLWVLEKDREKPGRLIWVLPVLMALWGNLHGGFAIGFILIATYLLGQIANVLGDRLLSKHSLDVIWKRYRNPLLRLAGVGLLSAVLLGLNPHGYKMLVYPFKTVSIGTLQNYIQEWQSPDFHQLQVMPFLGMLLLSLVDCCDHTCKSPFRRGDWDFDLHDHGIVGGPQYRHLRTGGHAWAGKASRISNRKVTPSSQGWERAP